jgi:hypothetical protein
VLRRTRTERVAAPTTGAEPAETDSEVAATVG